MGTWGYGIMDGDSPLDTEYEIMSFLNIPDKYEEEYDEAQYCELLQSKQLEILDLYNNHEDSYYRNKDYKNAELYQVLGYMLMSEGLNILPETKEKILWGLNYELNENYRDFDEPEARDTVLKNMIIKLKNYQNEPVDFLQTSLLDRIYTNSDAPKEKPLDK